MKYINCHETSTVLEFLIYNYKEEYLIAKFKQGATKEDLKHYKNISLDQFNAIESSAHKGKTLISVLRQNKKRGSFFETIKSTLSF
ncbi:hypothetical protein [Flammeovirga kamogawensis]|uniref:Uncharacterized protein n=1 Tax=Flammeovirga kamogawensis TaxID=373891 RepID=A0ABX8GZ31_9BACT|nr:hypothetical protein [Flammeovirga kamogawensis]MBB6459316.1 hypothetical protein [Flammeovirga kamogawensis]QWG08875.1 hypothetical protein KM029_08015 [Flammeovirga kamogawensis]TRX67165.1 hypothetical protein EO216_03060 [Flammeovirga kamogawensis]